MKDIFKLLACTSLCIGLFSQCTGIPDGYIPESIGIAQNEIVVQRGVDFKTQKPDLNGASYPVFFSLESVTDENGNHTTVLTDSVPIRIWKAPYDYKTDKTMDAIYAKLDIDNAPPLQVLEASGQLRFTVGTSQVPGGTYKISLKMTNSAGTRVYKDVLTVKIPTEEEMELYLMTISDTYSWNSEKPDGWNRIEEAATYDVQYDPNGENEIHLTVCDKNGSPFNWKNGEIVTRGTEDRGCLEQVSFEEPVYEASKAVYKYPFAPFPFAPGGTNEYNYYYRILRGYVKYDNPERSGYMNLLFNFRALADGTWNVKITYPAITRIPKI